MSTHLDRFNKNIQRVDNLCDIFDLVKNTSNRPTVKEADVLRAAVVFLHSAMEDYLRGVLTEYLPEYDNQNLEHIILYQEDVRTNKFSLGMLKKHSNLSVSELIHKSVEQQMSYTSFNNVKDIVGWLKRIGISSIDGTVVNLEQLDTTINRRHKIVHEMDANQQAGSGNHNAASINSQTVKAWRDNIINLINYIEGQLSNFNSDNEAN